MSDNSLLKECLDEVLLRFPPYARVYADPVSFPRKLFEEGRPQMEIETAAVVSSMLAYGSAAQVMKVVHKIIEPGGDDLVGYLKNRLLLSECPYYRLSNSRDIHYFCRAIAQVASEYNGFMDLFLDGKMRNDAITGGLARIREVALSVLRKMGAPETCGLMHLLPDPESGGCAKRWMMFLRWMVRRDDGVDMGLWPKIHPAELIIPLDRHISKIARNLGLTARKTDNLQTAIDITDALRRIDSEDPLKYDFALCHLGISRSCTHGRTREPCMQCLLRYICKEHERA